MTVDLKDDLNRLSKQAVELGSMLRSAAEDDDPNRSAIVAAKTLAHRIGRRCLALERESG